MDGEAAILDPAHRAVRPLHAVFVEMGAIDKVRRRYRDLAAILGMHGLEQRVRVAVEILFS